MAGQNHPPTPKPWWKGCCSGVSVPLWVSKSLSVPLSVSRCEVLPLPGPLPPCPHRVSAGLRQKKACLGFTFEAAQQIFTGGPEAPAVVGSGPDPSISTHYQ